MSMLPFNKGSRGIRGIRQPIQPGSILGRSGGVGAVTRANITQIAQLVQTTGIGGGGTGGGGAAAGPAPGQLTGVQAQQTAVSTSSTTAVMAGLGGSFKPIFTGRALIIISGNVSNATGGDGMQWQLSYGTGTAPVSGAALTGTQFGSSPVSTVTGKVPFTAQAVHAGFTSGTTYWLDLAINAVTGGTATFDNISISAQEF